MTAALMVSYPGSAGAAFDREYYVATHLPLVREQLGPHGLLEAVGYFPEAPGSVLAVAVLTFRDASARDAALASPEAAPVFGDIANFTAAQPIPTLLAVA